jgi:hypothetical protein
LVDFQDFRGGLRESETRPYNFRTLELRSFTIKEYFHSAINPERFGSNEHAPNTAEAWEQIKTVFASGIGLREIAEHGHP